MLSNGAQKAKNSKTIAQPAPKYHTKGCSRSSVDSLGARALVFAAFERFLDAEFSGIDSANALLCDTLSTKARLLI